ncbi:MAG: MBL fold metallo-hydrolase [Agathobacter sp.]|nr:MBL fold metallo-hydrolase [Agathobacter sp.]
MTFNNSTTTVKENVSQNEETSSEVDQNATETKQNTSNENIQKEAAIENQTAKDEKTEESKDVANKNDSTFSMHFIDVDQGDSTLVECDGEYMLIDGGNGYKGTTVQLYLTKQGVKELKYVVGTHPDVDHIGLDVIITKYSCGDVFLPNRTSETETYAELMDAMNYKSYKATCPNLGDVYTLGSSKITVIVPVDYDGDDNNCSIALKIDYGNTSFILSGDAESDEKAEILSKNSNLKANVYHAGHHGSRTSSSDSWLKEISPEAVVISCGKGNNPTTKMIQA